MSSTLSFGHESRRGNRRWRRSPSVWIVSSWISGRLAGPIVLADIGFVLLSSQALLASGTDRGVGLAIAALTLGVAWLVLRDAQPDLALVLGAGALTLGAVAVGNLVSGDGLTLAWAAEAAMLSLLAYRFGDARLQPAALGYLGLATGHLLVVTEPVDELFQTSVEASTAIPTLAVAAAATAAGLLVRRRSRPISSAATLPSAPCGASPA